MIVTLSDINPLKSFIDLVYDSATTIKLVFSRDGLNINLLNNSHVCFYNANFQVDYFDLYDVEDYEEIVVDAKDLYLILKSAKNSDILTIDFEEDNVRFIFESNGKRRNFTLSLIDELYNSPTPPSIDYDVDFVMDWSDLKQTTMDLDKIVGTDRFSITLNDTGVFVKSPADAMTYYNNQISTEAFDYTLSSTVNLDYMSILTKLSRIGDLHLRIGNSIPVSWSVNGDSVEYTGLIAPILEED